MERLFDKQTGTYYYESLPPGYRKAILADFHLNGRKKIGMEYLIQGAYWKVYQVCFLSERTTSKDIEPFIKFEMIWIKE